MSRNDGVAQPRESDALIEEPGQRLGHSRGRAGPGPVEVADADGSRADGGQRGSHLGGAEGGAAVGVDVEVHHPLPQVGDEADGDVVDVLPPFAGG